MNLTPQECALLVRGVLSVWHALIQGKTEWTNTEKLYGTLTFFLRTQFLVPAVLSQGSLGMSSCAKDHT